MSNNTDELLPLTPGHFLTGGPILSHVETKKHVGSESLANWWEKLKV